MAQTGTKRSHDGATIGNESNVATEQSNQIISVFEDFRNQLDDHYDRREKIVKTSRDITALSKKIIFTLQRLRFINGSIPDPIAKEVDTKLLQIRSLFDSLVPELDPLNTHRYQRNLSPAIQEFVEAVSFAHYLERQELISIEDIRLRLPAEILLTDEDYALGLFDLTGEIMRFAITSLSAGNMDHGPAGVAEAQERPKLPSSQASLVADLQQIRASFEAITVPKRHDLFREFSKKAEVMQCSVEKVERAAYGMLVRGNERPAEWTPSTSEMEVESY